MIGIFENDDSLLIFGLLFIIIAFLVVLLIIEIIRTKSVIVNKLFIHERFIKIVYKTYSNFILKVRQNSTEVINIGIDNILKSRKENIFTSFIYIECILILTSIRSVIVSQGFLESIFAVFILVIFVFSFSYRIYRYNRFFIVKLTLSQKEKSYKFIKLYFLSKNGRDDFLKLLKNEGNSM